MIDESSTKRPSDRSPRESAAMNARHRRQAPSFHAQRTESPLRSAVAQLSSRVGQAARARRAGELKHAVLLVARALGARAGGILQLSGDGTVAVTGVWHALRRGTKLMNASIPVAVTPSRLLRPRPLLWSGPQPLPEASRRVAEILRVAPVQRAIEVPLRHGWSIVGSLVLLTPRQPGPRPKDLASLQLAGDLIGSILVEMGPSRERSSNPAAALVPSSAAAPIVSLQSAIDRLPEEIAILDDAARVLSANQAWLRGPGPRNARTLPRVGDSYLRLWEGIRLPEASEIAGGIRAVISGSERQFKSRFRSRHPNRWSELSAARIDLGRSFNLLVVHRDVTQAERSARATRLLSRRLIRAQEVERRRIARELHDQTAQNLTAISLALGKAEQTFHAGDASLLSLLRETRELAEHSVAEIRTLSYLLHPPLLDEEGLVSAAHWYVSGFVKRSGIHTDLRVSDDFGRLPRDVELALFAVIQECLTNVYRHSGSDTARIILRRDRRCAVVEVSNEGGSPSIEQRAALQRSVGLGIRGIRERLHVVGGSLELRPRGKGLTAVATVPLASRHSRHAHADRR
jgi:signal transduction histidine kinase